MRYTVYAGNIAGTRRWGALAGFNTKLKAEAYVNTMKSLDRATGTIDTYKISTDDLQGKLSS